MHELSFGFSPCPNDTFAFHALVHGLVGRRPAGAPVAARHRGAEPRRAHAASSSCRRSASARSPGSATATAPLRAGAALGHGVGPLVVAREPPRWPRPRRAASPFPGLDTTAFLLLRQAAPALGEVVELRYDRILDAVASGEVDAGLIIHESRFTYQDHGLVRVADLGEWWEGETGLPVPLAVIGARPTSTTSWSSCAERSLRASVEHAFAHPEASREYVRAHSQELSDDVCDQHIALYVNEFSIDLGDDGMRAVEALTARSRRRRVRERSVQIAFESRRTACARRADPVGTRHENPTPPLIAVLAIARPRRRSPAPRSPRPTQTKITLPADPSVHHVPRDRRHRDSP